MMDKNKKNNANGDSPSTPTSLSKKIHSSFSKICFFRRKTTRHRPETAASGGPSPVRVSSTGRLFRSSTSWAHDRLPEFKDKCRRLIHDIGGRGRRRHSADFRYDAVSYSRNFDEGGGIGDDAEFRFRSFSSRLPQSPQRDDCDSDAEREAASPSGSASTSTLISTTTEIVSANGR